MMPTVASAVTVPAKTQLNLFYSQEDFNDVPLPDHVAEYP